MDLTPRGLVGLGYELKVDIQTDRLRGALRRADAARHGRGSAGILTDEDIQALVELDAHPALQALTDRYADEEWRKGQVDDLNEQARAEEYLDLLDSDEVERRLENVPAPYGAPGEDPGVPKQLCTVCNYEALIATGSDEMGYGIAPGVCFICSYRQSDAAAHELNLNAEWKARWEHL